MDPMKNEEIKLIKENVVLILEGLHRKDERIVKTQYMDMLITYIVQLGGKSICD